MHAMSGLYNGLEYEQICEAAWEGGAVGTCSLMINLPEGIFFVYYYAKTNIQLFVKTRLAVRPDDDKTYFRSGGSQSGMCNE